MRTTESSTAEYTRTTIDIPLSIFSSNLSSLESLTKYLKENLNLSYSVIARLLNRDDRTIWGTYQRCIRKNPNQLNVASHSSGAVPLSLFQNRALGAMEALVFYLRNKNR